jgi:FkbM family methyltransferase
VATGVKRALADEVRHWRTWLTSPEFRRRERERRRLRTLPRYHAASTDLLGPTILFADARSFLFSHRQIFDAEIYRFDTSDAAPRILDCGANIGLSVLYFKRLHPRSRITAFEPDPNLFSMLEANCRSHALADVELVPKAAWTCEALLPFSAEGSDAGRLLGIGPGIARAAERTVAAARLRDHLGGERIALLKLDVEGAEAEILLDCADRLGDVERVFVEAHSLIGREQRLDEVLAVLRSAGFRTHVQPELVSPKPFVRRMDSWGMDQRLNVYAYRT